MAAGGAGARRPPVAARRMRRRGRVAPCALPPRAAAAATLALGRALGGGASQSILIGLSGVPVADYGRAWTEALTGCVVREEAPLRFEYHGGHPTSTGVHCWHLYFGKGVNDFLGSVYGVRGASADRRPGSGGRRSCTADASPPVVLATFPDARRCFYLQR